jgi:hypothetical protein
MAWRWASCKERRMQVGGRDGEREERVVREKERLVEVGKGRKGVKRKEEKVQGKEGGGKEGEEKAKANIEEAKANVGLCALRMLLEKDDS